MRIINQSKNTILADEAIIAGTLLKRMIGLLGRKELKKGQALILKPCNSIHTFFMRFSIDVLFVDKENKVIKAISSKEPFRLTYMYFTACFAVELPVGTIQSSATSPGDSLTLL